MSFKSFHSNPGPDCYYQYDEHGFMVIKDKPTSIDDAGGRNALFYKATGFSPLYHDTLKGGCVLKVANSYGSYEYEYRRHPSYDWGTSDMSRDHVTYMFILTWFGIQDNRKGSLSLLRDMIDNTPYRISEKTTFTPDMWCWMKGLLSKKWENRFYAIEIPWMKYMARRNKRLINKGEFGPPLNQYEFDAHHVNRTITPKQDRIRGRIYPFYALHILSWQLYCYDDSPKRRKLHKIILDMVDPGNYLVRLLCNDMTVTKSDVLNYRDMTGYRWGVFLNNLCRRDCYILSDEQVEWNRLESDLLITIWNEKHPYDKIAA